MNNPFPTVYNTDHADGWKCEKVEKNGQKERYTYGL